MRQLRHRTSHLDRITRTNGDVITQLQFRTFEHDGLLMHCELGLVNAQTWEFQVWVSGVLSLTLYDAHATSAWAMLDTQPEIIMVQVQL